MSEKIYSQTNNINIYKPIGNYLIEADLITENCLTKALEEQKETQEKIGDILIRQGKIKQNTLNYLIENVIEPERHEIASSNLSELALNGTSERLSGTLNIPSWDLSPRKITKSLIAIVISLILLSCIAQFGAFFLNQSSSAGYSGRLFRLDEEINIPTLYSSLSLAFAGVLLGIIGYMKKVIESPYKRYWQVLSGIFLYLAIDEMCSIHEILSALRPVLNASGFFYFAWVIPGMILVFLFVIVYWRFIQSLPKSTKNLFLIAGCMYVGGAIGVEMIGGYYSENYGENTPTYAIITTIEESLEMFGIVVFIYALLSYIKSQLKIVNLQLSFDGDLASGEIAGDRKF